MYNFSINLNKFYIDNKHDILKNNIKLNIIYIKIV